MSPAPPASCNEIIPNLFLGDITAVSQKQALADKCVHAVVCCLREMELPTCEFHQGLDYCRVDVEDIGVEPIELFWPEATEFIHRSLSLGRAVLVHCRAGVSRSASTVIAYLIEYHGYSLHDAFALVRSRRPVATPNLGFMQKLIDFEALVRATAPSIAMDKYQDWYHGSHMEEIADVKADTVVADPHSSDIQHEDICHLPNVALAAASEQQLSSPESVRAAQCEANVVEVQEDAVDFAKRASQPTSLARHGTWSKYFCAHPVNTGTCLPEVLFATMLPLQA